MSLRSSFQGYIQRVRAFQPNARLYLLSVLVTGATMGVFRLLFNFYVLSLGYDEALLGNLITTGNTTALIAALPMGYLVDYIGRKPALLLRSAILSIAVISLALWPSVINFFAMNALFGIAQSLSAVAMAPFLMENSGEEERTYLFSFGQGLQMGSVFIGNWLGGYLPTWVASYRGVLPNNSSAYGGSLLVIGILALIALVPLSRIRPSRAMISERSLFAPFEYARREPKLIGKLLLPSLMISIGAGFFMPFMNVFFRVVHSQSDKAIGTLFAWGSLAMGIGLIIAPPLAERYGKIRLVATTQGLSIPFMVMLGFAPIFWLSASAYYVRLTIMNMSNPIYQTFVMEQVSEEARATVASLVSMVWSFGRALSPTISGQLQVNYGFGPPFGIAIALYMLGVTMYWRFFLRKTTTPIPGTSAGN